MGKYNVCFSCGHEEEVELFGKIKDRNRKIEYFEERGVCSKCYRDMKNMKLADGCDEVEMLYGDYVHYYSSCKKKDGSYNSKTKTIVVYVPHGYKAKYSKNDDSDIVATLNNLNELRKGNKDERKVQQ